MLYDITRTVSASSAVWPGDAPYQTQLGWSLAAGQAVNLVTITTTPHVGTHADAYYHYEIAGAHPATMPLDAYLGRVRVVTVSKRDGALTPTDIPVALDGAERVLIHSHVSDLPDSTFAPEFPYLSVELIAWLASLGIRLIGLDSPSVDAFDSQELPCHHALARHGLVNLENVYLRDVPDGDYELIALPLKLDAACASPVRAVLRSLNER
ncbi:MAG: cyclase family protein [Chloroflexi bacterium]|uniref:cyclase family protein n=1 Tax=Candidatus Flexifilum breve TaxID=3140694 RepID=UPI0031366C4E|nr:cyclase family protein [Chloroflexota bacterium]MBK9748131.1 cyclase family protein [Chloroflexota bacterium]